MGAVCTFTILITFSLIYHSRLSIRFLHLLVSVLERNDNTIVQENTIQNVIDHQHVVRPFLAYSRTMIVEEQLLSENNLIHFPTSIVKNHLVIVMSKQSLVKHLK